MKKFLIGTFALLLVYATFVSNPLLANQASAQTIEPQQNEVNLQEENKEFIQGNLFPFLGENFGFPMEFSKSNILIVSIILCISFLVFAHKNNFETDIYAFYHTNRDGSIIFETTEEQRAFEFRSFLAKTFRVLGILTGFTSLILLFL
jgi:hypothetical protein